MRQALAGYSALARSIEVPGRLPFLWAFFGRRSVNRISAVWGNDPALRRRVDQAIEREPPTKRKRQVHGPTTLCKHSEDGSFIVRQRRQRCHVVSPFALSSLNVGAHKEFRIS